VPPPLLPIEAGFGKLESRKDPAADLGRLVDLLQARGDRLPGLIAEIMMAGAGRDDQIIEGGPAHVGDDFPPFPVNSDDALHQHQGVLLARQNVPDGRCNLRRGQEGRRHLIEKGLEQMVVAPVDHDHLDRRVAQLQGSVEAAESGADNDHPGLR
jgi:hypothetical protein